MTASRYLRRRDVRGREAYEVVVDGEVVGSVARTHDTDERWWALGPHGGEIHEWVRPASKIDAAKMVADDYARRAARRTA